MKIGLSDHRNSMVFASRNSGSDYIRLALRAIDYDYDPWPELMLDDVTSEAVASIVELQDEDFT